MRGFVFKRVDSRKPGKVEYLRIIRADVRLPAYCLTLAGCDLYSDGYSPFAVHGVTKNADEPIPDDVGFTWITDLDGDPIPDLEKIVWTVPDVTDEVPDVVVHAVAVGWAYDGRMSVTPVSSLAVLAYMGLAT